MKIALNRNVLLLCATLLLILGVVYVAKKPLISGNGNSAAVSLADGESDQSISGDIQITTLPEESQNEVRTEPENTTPLLPVTQNNESTTQAQVEENTTQARVNTQTTASTTEARSTSSTPVAEQTTETPVQTVQTAAQPVNSGAGQSTSTTTQTSTGGSGLTGASAGGGSAPLPVAPTIVLTTVVAANYATSSLALSGTATDNSIITVRTISAAYGTTTATTTAVAGNWSLGQSYPHGPVTIEVFATLGGLASNIVTSTTSFTYTSIAPVVAGRYTKAESPYLLDSIPFGTVDNPVTIEPGTVIKLRPGGKIDGTQCATRCILRIGDVTSGERVIITSASDDSVMGDTNEDGPSSGSPYDWNGITLGNNSELYIENTLMKFGGNTVVNAGKLEFKSVSLESNGVDIITQGSAQILLDNIDIASSITGDGSSTSTLTIQNSRVAGPAAVFSGFGNYEITNNQFTGPSSVIDISSSLSSNISGNTTENIIELIISDSAPAFTDSSFIYRLRPTFIAALQAESGSILKLPAAGIAGSLDTIEVRGDATTPVIVYQDSSTTYGDPFGITPLSKIGCVDLIRDGVTTRFGSCVTI